MNDDLVFVDEFVSGIRWDAKYATWDNLVGKPVDGYLVNLRNTSARNPMSRINSSGVLAMTSRRGDCVW